MKKTHILSAFFILFFLAHWADVNSQTKAVTEYGDTIYVYDNGTWAYELLDELPQSNGFEFLNAKIKIDTLSDKLTTPSNAKKVIKNKRGQFTIKYNDKLWKRVPPATLNEEAEFALESKTSDIWCIVISEETEISIESLFKIAKNTMETNSGSKVEILNSQIRNVNNTNMLRGTLSTNFSGIAFIFDSYYFSNDSGSVQFTVWSSDKIWAKNEKEIIELLNGINID